MILEVFAEQKPKKFTCDYLKGKMMGNSNEVFFKMENSLINIKNFVKRFTRTFYLLFFRRAFFLSLIGKDKIEEHILYPFTFLLSCGILFGFLGSILEAGRESISFRTFLNIKDLSFSSYLTITVPVFLIAWFAGTLIDIILDDSQRIKSKIIKGLMCYVIGFFSLGTIVMIIILWFVFLLTFSYFDWSTKILFTILASIIILFIVSTFWFLHRSSQSILQIAPKTHSRIRAFLLDVVNLGVIVLCIANFVYPLSQSREFDKITGSTIDLEFEDPIIVKLTYLLTNKSDSPLILNFLDKHKFIFTTKDIMTMSSYATFSPNCSSDPGQLDFKLLKPGESILLTSYICDSELASYIDTTFPKNDRAPKKWRVLPADFNKMDITLEIEYSGDGYKAEPKRIDL